MLANRTLRTILLLLVATATLASCGSHWPNERTWKEEVRLSDGRVIQVERHERYRVLSELGGLSTLITESSELSVLPTPGEGLPLLKTGDGGMWEVPLIVDVDATTGTYFAITIVEREYDAKAAGLDSRKPYFEYRLADGTWKRQPVSDQKLGWNTNLLLTLALMKEKNFIPLAEKEAADGLLSEHKCVLMPVLNGRCSWPRALTWPEEVQLADGRVITVERHERYRVPSDLTGVPAVGGPGDPSRESTELRILPTPSEKLAVLRTGDGNISEVPLIVDLDVATGTYFAITIVDHGDEAIAAGLDPRRPYFEYRLTDGTWKRQPVSEQKMGWKSNLLLGLSPVRWKNHASLADKKAANDDERVGPEYKCVRSSPSGRECSRG